ncbi:MAG: hypothetical protein IJ243_04765 [Prevotella sp.]|nr:hypothetical protein [Prevotella sp.]
MGRFEQLFWRFFAIEDAFVRPPNFQKSTPNFQKALTFENRSSPFFEEIAANCLNFNALVKTQKMAVFFVQSFSRAEFSKFEALKRGNFEHCLKNLNFLAWLPCNSFILCTFAGRILKN